MDGLRSDLVAARRAVAAAEAETDQAREQSRVPMWTGPELAPSPFQRRWS